VEIPVGGICVNYLDIGNKDAAETVLILQGWGTKAELYSGLAEHLSKSMRVLLPEFPGFGKTPEPKTAFSADDYADFTLAFLKAMGINKVSLIGHSHGGRVIMKLTTRGDVGIEFKKLVFIDSAGIIQKKTLKKRIRQAAFKLCKTCLKPFPKALERYRNSHGSADYRNASPIMKQSLVKLVNEDFTPLMPKIKQPALLIWGTMDKDTPIENGRIMEKLIPDAGLVEVPGAGHYSYLEQPAFVYRVLDSYFNV
jgi:pimeloyl-ACP methyl ester carboxylesterase